MKNNSPWVWGLITLILGWWFAGSGNFNDFIIVMFSVVMVKLIEIYNLINKNN